MGQTVEGVTEGLLDLLHHPGHLALFQTPLFHIELDERLERAKKQAAEEGAAIASRQARVKADLLAREVAGETQVFELQVESLEARIKAQDEQIAALSAKIDATLGSAQDLAVKAIQGAELSSSFETLKRIALEQARSPQKGK